MLVCSGRGLLGVFCSLVMFATCCLKGKGKGKNGMGLDKGKGKGFDKASDKGKGKGFDKGKGKGFGQYQGYVYEPACHYCGEVGYKRAECLKCGKDHQNQIRAVDEEEATEQVECQTCWRVGQADEVVPPREASWSRPRKLEGPGLARWTKCGPARLGFRAAHGHGCTVACCHPFKVLHEEEDCDINEVKEEPVNKVVDVTIDSAGTCGRRGRKC